MTDEEEDRFWSKVEKGSPRACWQWTGALSSNGYGVAFDPQLQATRHAHRVAWLITYGEYPPKGLDLCHSCDNRACVNPNHLFVGTRTDNMQDMARKGRHGRTVLTPQKVRTIRRLRREGFLLREISAEIGVSVPAVHSVLAGKTWTHVVG